MILQVSNFLDSVLDEHELVHRYLDDIGAPRNNNDGEPWGIIERFACFLTKSADLAPNMAPTAEDEAIADVVFAEVMQSKRQPRQVIAEQIHLLREATYWKGYHIGKNDNE